MITENIHIIGVEDDGVCSDCGKTAELRPYGIDGAWVCFDCAMKDEENAKKMFKKRLEGDTTHSTGTLQ